MLRPAKTRSRTSGWPCPKKLLRLVVGAGVAVAVEVLVVFEMEGDVAELRGLR